MRFTESEQRQLKDLGIQAIILFGSRAQNTASSASDYDIGALGRNNKQIYDFLYDLLSRKINQLVNIDIVFLTDAPMELQAHVAKYGQLLYE